MAKLKLNIIAGLFAVAPLLSSCGALKYDNDAHRLASYMEGDFSSKLMKEKYEDEGYQDIRLHIRRIWKDDKEAYWLYVEQTLFAQEKERMPFRQRIYKLTLDEENNSVKCKLYLWEDEGWEESITYKSLAALESISQEELEELEGCAFYFYPRGDESFGGRQRSARNNCKSSDGETYVRTTSLKVTPKMIQSKDHGKTTDKSKKVWGADHKYQFYKIK